MFETIGHIFLSLFNLTSVIKRYVYNETEDERALDVEAFAAESQSLRYLNPDIEMSSERHFQQFHDFTLKCGQPMGTLLVTDKENCRKCGKALVLDKKSHPVIIYHTQRGTYIGSRLVKQCRKCQIHEHYGHWTIEGQKHFDAATLQLPFLLSTEDTAFDMILLKECSNLLVVGAVPFSTFASAYNRRFGYRNISNKDEKPKFKRLKRYVLSL